MGEMNRAYQRGITLTGLIFGSIVLILIAVLGMKVVPDVIEYAKIVSNIKAVAQDPALREASATDVRRSYDRRANIDQISAIKAQDIEITRGPSNHLILSFAYRREIRLFGPVSLAIDFEGSSDQ